MKIRAVDFVLYHVSDLGRAVEFYRDRLHLRLEVQSEEYHWAEFDCGNLTLALFAGQHVVGAATGARVALAVDDIDAAYAELSTRGVRIVEPPQDHGVCRAFNILDPDGNPILLHCRADGTFGR